MTDLPTDQPDSATPVAPSDPPPPPSRWATDTTPITVASPPPPPTPPSTPAAAPRPAATDIAAPAVTRRVVVAATAAPATPASPYVGSPRPATLGEPADANEPAATTTSPNARDATQPLTAPPTSPPPARPTPAAAQPPAKRDGLPFRSYVAIALAGALGAAAVVVPALNREDASLTSPPVADNISLDGIPDGQTAPDIAPLPGTSDGSLVAAIAQRVTPSVLRIDVVTATGGGSGSGVVLTSDGAILTNAHVVEGATSITVLTPDGERLDATLVAAAASYDIAVIRVTATDLPVPTFATREPVVGDTAVAIGSPFGLDGSVTAGIISGVGRTLSTGGVSLLDLLQTDAAINPGNSGGALVNAAGEVVGINTAILSASGANDGVGFAVPVQTALNVAKDLVEFGEVRAGYLGIEGQSVDPEVARLYDLTVEKGAVVVTVVPGTPADVAGLQEGDIIIGVDDEPITSMLDLAVLVQRREPGEVVQIEIVRDDATLTLELTLGTRP